MTRLSLWTVASRSVRYFVRSNVALCLGFAAATAVLVGALVVGDSVNGSLRQVVTNRLANIECLLQARTFFDSKILDDLGTESGESEVVPGMLFSSSTVEKRTGQGVTRASKVQLLAFEQQFWDAVGMRVQQAPLGEDEVALNESLAEELQLSVGDEIAVRVQQLTSVSGDSPLGDRDDASINVPRQKVTAILPDDGIGGVSFLAGQAAARNVFLSLATLQDALDQEQHVNAALVLKADPAGNEIGLSRIWCDELNLQLLPSIEDYGLRLERHQRVFPESDLDTPPVAGLPPDTIFDYLQLTSRELILDDETVEAVRNQFEPADASPLITYLANSIAKVEPLEADLYERRKVTATRTGVPNSRSVGGRVYPSISALDPAADPDLPPDRLMDLPLLSREVPYSIMVGVERLTELQLENYTQVDRDAHYWPYCWVNTWLANELEASPGDWVQIKFFEPETVDGLEIEKAARLMIAGIVPLTEPTKGYSRRSPAAFSSPPTIFNDSGLTPTVPGVTDQQSISNWDVPFELVNPLQEADDLYWENHRLTPKLLMPYQTASAAEFFGSRFGRTTAVRFSSELSNNQAELRRRVQEALLDTRKLNGLIFRPVREQLLAGASGTTPFDQLFLALSFFVIVAALLLVFLLFKLAIQQRSSQLGILLAQGFAPNRVLRLILIEMTCVGCIGASLGIGLGIAYARGIIAGLESWWIGAISTGFLSFFADASSLVIGSMSGLLAGLAAVYLALRRASRQNALSILRGHADVPGEGQAASGRVPLIIAGSAGMAACGLIALAFFQTGMARAGSFFGSGMLLLVACLAALRVVIELGRGGGRLLLSGSLLQLAWRAVCRNPGRSSLCVGLLAVATFLIASMSVFQIAPSEKGYGSFDLIAESSRPIYRNLGYTGVRRDMLGDGADRLEASTIVPMRSRSGEDASCNNLFQAARPTVIGVPTQLADLHTLSADKIEFEWSKVASQENPWGTLQRMGNGTEMSPIPVILDQNTADWSLKQGGSLGALIRIDFDSGPVYFRTVGLLANSIFQGKLLISQQNFEGLFPRIGGYNFFLIHSDDTQEPEDVAEALESGWSAEGLDVMSSADVLAKYLGVQNTYINAFQSLGALGLLLGTFGLIAVQLRSVMERRSELALMQAVGFAPRRISQLLTVETAILLGGGLTVGALCSAAALIPYVIEVGPKLSILQPLLMLIIVLAVGFVAAFIAARAAMKHSVLEGLRSE